MKKSICILVFLLLLFSFTACGGGQPAGQRETETEAQSEKAPEITETEKQSEEETMNNTNPDKLLYQGHASLRITTGEGKVIYVDPYAGEGYEKTADLILITHGHYDHNAPEKVENRTSGCRIISWKEALEDGSHQTFDLGFATVEAVEAGYNRNHNVKECVGYVITLRSGVSVYVTGDTSETRQMPSLFEKKIDYAFFCCDGEYNMNASEAAACASLVGAKHNVPYHTFVGKLFDSAVAEKFTAENRLIITPGEEIDLEP